MIGPSGFMQSPQRRTAWCVRCDGPQEVDERGCIACAKRIPCEACEVRHTGSCIDYRRNRLARKRARANAWIKRYHAAMKADGLCITSAKHGAAVPGKTRCAGCVEMHRRSS